MAIDFTLSESQRVLQKNAREFAERVLEPIVDKIDRSADAWESFLAGREAYRQTALAGFTKSFIPVFYGVLASPYSISRLPPKNSVVSMSTYPPRCSRMGWPCAFTDVAGGANFDSPDPAGGIQTIAQRDGDEWVITGEKHYTTNGTGWDKKGSHLYTVICRTDPAAGADQALAIIAVPGNRHGISVVDVYDKIGHRGVVTPRIHFDHVRVPASYLIGQPGLQAKRIRRSIQLDRGSDRGGMRGHHAGGL